jgi:hypothetical protein
MLFEYLTFAASSNESILPDSPEKLNAGFCAVFRGQVNLERHRTEQKHRETTADSDFHDAP